MIVSRTPLRISLGGGGTDLPHYYKKYGGFVISTAIQKYVYVIVSNHFENIIKLNYSKPEICHHVNQIKHPIIREALKLLKLKNHIEITSLADVPANSGLGSSGSFTVGLLNSLHSFKNKSISRKKLAEMATHIEMNLLKAPIGKQDQYIAAFGGFTCFYIDKKGKVSIKPLNISNRTIKNLEQNLTFFYTGILRKSWSIIKDQKINSQKNESSLDSMTRIKKIGYKIKRCLENDDLDEFGVLMDEHWEAKKKTSSKISNSQIDLYYNLAKNNGALGGKLIGAGGGGFLMFYTRTLRHKQQLIKILGNKGLKEIPMKFEPKGTKIIFKLK